MDAQFPPLVDLRSYIEYDMNRAIERFIKQTDWYTGTPLNPDDDDIMKMLHKDNLEHLSLLVERDLIAIKQLYIVCVNAKVKFEIPGGRLLEDLNEIRNLAIVTSYPLIAEPLNKIEKLLNSYGIHDKNSDNDILSEKLTFNIELPADIKDEFKNASQVAYHLYKKTKEIFDAKEIDFVNAFTGKDLTGPIKVKIKAKNKYYSKSSLFYFINELLRLKILPFHSEDFKRRKIENIFLDGNGDKLKNLSQSAKNVGHAPAGHEVIDKAISSLFK